MLKVQISIENDKGKKAEIEINETDNLSKLVIIQNVFNLFGISNDVMEMTETYNKIGKAYESFFQSVDSVESEVVINKPQITAEELSKSLVENKEELENVYKEQNDSPEYIQTGIKLKNGTELYRLHYKCIACWNKGTHYIYKESKITWCHKCQHEMVVYPATPKGFPDRDTFGNFFRAGDFQDYNVY